MSVVEKFNGLNGAVVTRNEIASLIADAAKQGQFLIVQRLETVLYSHPNEHEFTLNITEPAFEQVPESLLHCLPFEADNHEAIYGLGKPVSTDAIYSMVTDLMLNTIKEVGHLPWQKEWTGTGLFGAMNYVSKKVYSGINFLTLNFDIKTSKNGKRYLVPAEFKQPYYLTFNQIQEAGATLKKGSKGREVIYYNFIINYKDGKLKFSGSDANKFAAFVKQHGITPEQVKKHTTRVPILKYYNVFRADDCTGLKFKEVKQREIEPNETAQLIIDNYPNHPRYILGEDNRAYYTPVLDTVNMPLITAFNKEAAYYSTFFHEIVHSTGHSKRLDRNMSGSKGNSDYAFEELIAELGAVYLSAESGILFHTRENSAKYLRGWNSRLVGELENDNRFFMRAAAQAQKAADWILDYDADDVPAYVRKSVKNTVAEKPQQKLKTKPKKKTIAEKPNQKLKKPTKKHLEKVNPEPKVEPNGQTALFGAVSNIEVNEPIIETEKIIEKPVISQNSKVQKIGSSNSEAAEFYTVKGEFGNFLQRVERKKVHSVVITMDGEQGAGKTTTLYKAMEAFASAGNKCLFISGEEHPTSALAIEKTEKYLSEASKQNIDTIGEVESKEELYDLIKPYEIVFIDSWQKLLRMVGNLQLDEDLRKAFDGKVFVIIFQQTTTGRTKGGAEVVFDGDIIIKMVKGERFSENYAYFDKHRYTVVPTETIRYNIAAGTVYNPEQPETNSDSSPEIVSEIKALPFEVN